MPVPAGSRGGRDELNDGRLCESMEGPHFSSTKGESYNIATSILVVKKEIKPNNQGI